MERQLARVEALAAAGKPYEALQLCRTLVTRAKAAQQKQTNKPQTRVNATATAAATQPAELIAAGVASLLSSANAVAEAADLAMELIQIPSKSSEEQKEDHEYLVGHAVRIASALRQACAKGGPNLSFDAPERFIAKACEWSAKMGKASGNDSVTVAKDGANGHPMLHLELARILVLGGEFSRALSHAIRADESADTSDDVVVLLCRIYRSFAADVLPSERDVVFARVVLATVALRGNLRAASAVIDDALCRREVAGLASQQPQEVADVMGPLPDRPVLPDTPLVHFVDFVVQTCERAGTAHELFDELRVRYRPSTERDPELDPLLDWIAFKFFGVEPARSATAVDANSPFGGMMQSMMQGLFQSPGGAGGAGRSLFG